MITNCLRIYPFTKEVHGRNNVLASVLGLQKRARVIDGYPLERAYDVVLLHRASTFLCRAIIRHTSYAQVLCILHAVHLVEPLANFFQCLLSSQVLSRSPIMQFTRCSFSSIPFTLSKVHFSRSPSNPTVPNRIVALVNMKRVLLKQGLGPASIN